MAKIIGNTTATPNPRPDWEQTDDAKADYIKNKPDLTDILRYGKQKLTDEQKDLARANIGAVSIEDVEAIVNGGNNGQISLTGELVELDVDAETPLSVVSVFNRDTTWGLSNTLVLHQVSGNNFVDFTSFLDGPGTSYERNGMTITVNNDSTVSIKGTNNSASSVNAINRNHWDEKYISKVYPAGTYTIPEGFTIVVRAAVYPENVNIPEVTGNLRGTITIPEPFRVVSLIYSVGGNETIDVTVPLGLFYGNSVPETGFEYLGNIYTVTFDTPIYEGEFNWKTGELKDIDGNTIAYYDAHEIKSLPNTNYFWTGFGENTISNKKDDGKIILRLNETAPEETISSICDFMFVPTTPEAAYGLYRDYFLSGGKFFGKEVPILTTKGTLSVKDIDGNIKYSKYIDPILNSRGISDTLTHKGLKKQWSKKFYLNKEPVSITVSHPGWTGPLDAYIIVWEFDENEFINTGIPAKIHDIPMASPCFINNDNSETNVLKQDMWNGTPYPAFFSYNSEAKKYTLTVRGINAATENDVKTQISIYSKVYFYYQLESSYDIPFTFAMGIEAGDQILFDLDVSDNQPYIDSLDAFKNKDINPVITVFVPRSIEDALDGMNNTAIILNTDKTTGGDATVQGYSWIGAGDGTTDYTLQIQSKLDELHNISDGGTIHLGPGTYPISKSLIVYNNTQIIGDGHTIIKQTADNTHAIIWNGSNIRVSDLTIKLAGACTELTACIYANSNNVAGGNRDEKYPENLYVQYCSINNVVMTGTYEFSWEGEYQILTDEALTYRGVGVYSKSLYFNFFNCDGLTCKNLYAGIYNGGGANNYNIYVTDSRFAVWGGGANNIFDIIGHTYYVYGRDGRINGTEYAYYGQDSDANEIKICFYDSQYSNGIIYFDGTCQRNKYSITPNISGISTTISGGGWGNFKKVRDFGRANNEIQPFSERYVGIGSALYGITGLPYWNTQFNPSINNALSGAGRWGTITSNKEWTSNEIELSDICRYPKDTLKTYFGLASTVCSVSPSEESPIEIIIDISNRPVTNYQGFWIQFDHRYVAEKYTVSFDTTNDGTFNLVAFEDTCNENVIACRLNYQEPSLMVYRIKISITKALQIPEFKYAEPDYTSFTINYNPDGLVGIANIGMPSNEAYGRAFLGECGGNIYGDLLLNKDSTIKNVPMPTEDNDVASKIYADTIVDTKVDKEEGKSLSTNDFTDEYKQSLDSLKNMTFEETDPTVPDWAKQPSKPTYIAAEVGATTLAEVNAQIDDSIDQVYSSTSTNAQSGTAVAQAIANMVETTPDMITTLQNLTTLLSTETDLGVALEEQISQKINRYEIEKINVSELLVTTGYVRSDGVFKSPTGLYRTDFIPVRAGDKYIYSLKTYYSATSINPIIAWCATNELNSSGNGVLNYNANNSVLQTSDEILTGEYIAPADGYVMISNDIINSPNPEFYLLNNIADQLSKKADKEDIETFVNTVIDINELLTIAGRISNTGGIKSTEGYTRSDYIPVSHGDAYVYSLLTWADESPVIAWYDLTKTYHAENSAVQPTNIESLLSGEYTVPADGYIIISNRNTNEHPKFYRKNVIGQIDSAVDDLGAEVHSINDELEYLQQVDGRIGNFDYFFRNATPGMLRVYGTVYECYDNEDYLITPYIRVYAGDILYYNLLGDRNKELEWTTSLLTIYNLDKVGVGYVRPEVNGVANDAIYTFTHDGYVRLCNHKDHKGVAYFQHSIEYEMKNLNVDPTPETSDDVVRWCAMGDSIVQGYWSTYIAKVTDSQGNVSNKHTEEITEDFDSSSSGAYGWVNYVAEAKGYELTNYAIGGSGWICKRDVIKPVDNAKQLVDSGDIDFTQFDLVTLSYGVNDWKGSCDIGNASDAIPEDDPEIGTTMCTNMKYVIEKIMNINPKCKIIVTSPINCRMAPNDTYSTFDVNYGIGTSFGNSGTLADIFNKEKQICEYYGIEFIDMTYSSIINRCNIETLLPDGAHPSKAAHKLLARELIDKINFSKI